MTRLGKCCMGGFGQIGVYRVSEFRYTGHNNINCISGSLFLLGHCNDSYPTLSQNQGSVGRIRLAGQIRTPEACEQTCNNYAATCYGFDYNHQDSTCFVNLNRNYSLIGYTNTVNYRREALCKSRYKYSLCITLT